MKHIGGNSRNPTLNLRIFYFLRLVKLEKQKEIAPGILQMMDLGISDKMRH